MEILIGLAALFVVIAVFMPEGKRYRIEITRRERERRDSDES